MTDQGLPPPTGDDPTPPAGTGEPGSEDSTMEMPEAPGAPGPDDATLVQPPVPPPPPPPVGPDEPVPTPWWRRWWAIALFILIGLIILGALLAEDEGEPTTTSSTATSTGGVSTTGTSAASTSQAPTSTTSSASTSTSTTAPPTTTTTSAPTTTTTLAPREAAFSDGTHLVGQDVDPAIYETGIIDAFGCYWERLSGLGGTLEEIIANENVDTHAIVEVMDGDEALTTTACGDWYVLADLPAPLTEIPPGTWAIGPHLEPGRYEAGGGDSCYWARLSGFSGELDDIIANDLGTTLIVDTSDGDAGFTSTGCGTWTPVG